MRRPIIIFAIVCGGTWLPTTVVVAQNMGGTYTNYTYTPPAVSPYLNLTMNANGLSNYQSLVKPMLDEQDALSWQSANLSQLQQQMRQGRAPAVQGPRDSSGRETSSRQRPAGRFMNFSHYYGYGTGP